MIFIIFFKEGDKRRGFVVVEVGEDNVWEGLDDAGGVVVERLIESGIGEVEVGLFYNPRVCNDTGAKVFIEGEEGVVGEEVAEILGADHRGEGCLVWVRLGGWEVGVEEAGGGYVVFEELEGFGMDGEDAVEVGGVFEAGWNKFEVEG